MWGVFTKLFLGDCMVYCLLLTMLYLSEFEIIFSAIYGADSHCLLDSRTNYMPTICVAEQ